jgi:hypothetical protein
MLANSLQPYLSCINQWHADMGLEKPAVGHLIQNLRSSFGKLEGDDIEGVVSRHPIPDPVMLQVLHLARNSRRDRTQRGRLPVCRAATASCLAFAFMLCCEETAWCSSVGRILQSLQMGSLFELGPKRAAGQLLRQSTGLVVMRFTTSSACG